MLVGHGEPQEQEHHTSMGSALFNLTDKSWTTSSGWQQLLRSGWKPSGISDPFAPLERDQSYPSQQGKAITPKRIQLRKVLPPQECWNSPFPQNAPQILVLSLPNQRGLKMRWDCAQPSWDTPVATLGKPPSMPAYLLPVSEWSCSFVLVGFQFHFFLLLVEMWNS